VEVPVTAKAALLQVLMEGPGYGLDLVDRVLGRTNGAIRLGDASVYPALRSMEREGLLRSWVGDPLPERGGRPRRYYELTAEGLRTARTAKETITRLFGAPALQGGK
jgi:PadR family transcriptional regulator PadR